MGLFDFLAPLAIAIVCIQQLSFVLWFLAALRSNHRRCQTPPPHAELPVTLVVLKLRGADPYLADCVRGLLQQDHPRYQVRIIVDSKQDDAWPVVQDVLASLPSDHVEVQPLDNPSESCSLVCSAMLQATEDLPPDCEAIVSLDADVVAHPSWLREITAPLRDPRVGVARGIRWFAPPVGRWGSWIRYLWNLGVEVTAYFHQIPWGGSVAVKVSVLRETDLRQRWKESANEDILIGAAIRKLKLKMSWVPGLVMVNREECGISSCFGFTHRQQLWGRLYNPAAFWPNIGISVMIFSALLWGLIWGLFALLQGRLPAATANLMLPAVLLAVQSLIVVIVERTMRRFLADRNMAGARLSAKTFLALAVSPLWSCYSLCRSFIVNTYQWRGIEYQVRGPAKVTLKYRPYQPAANQRNAAAAESLDSL